MNTSMRFAARVGVCLMSSLAALVCVAPSLRAQQGANVLPAIPSWTVAVQPSQVQVTVGAGSIAFQAVSSSSQLSAVQVDVSFQVQQAGRYLLWLDAFWAIPTDSGNPWVWSIPGVGSSGWVQYQASGRRLARSRSGWSGCRLDPTRSP